MRNTNDIVVQREFSSQLPCPNPSCSESPTPLLVLPFIKRLFLKLTTPNFVVPYTQQDSNWEHVNPAFGRLSSTSLPNPSRRASRDTFPRSSCQRARPSTPACCRWSPCAAGNGWAASWTRPIQRSYACPRLRTMWVRLRDSRDRVPPERPQSGSDLVLFLGGGGCCCS